MFSHKRVLAGVLTLLLSVGSLFALEKKERIIAGGPSDSLEVRHLILRGTNEEIGRALAEIAAERYRTKPEPSRDPLRTRAQRRYIEKNYPILYDRMRGVAAAFDHRADDDAWDHSQLGFTNLRAGCSIIHLPPNTTANGKSVVSRDYDYSTGNLTFGFLPPGVLHPTARPYLVELHPDRGYASIAMVAYDFLSGVLDGMNSEGLTVTMAMDDEMFTTHKIEPVYGTATGLGELQTMRLLLDTCANVDEAKEALLTAKQYYAYVPVHYLIADRFGRSFVWEYSEQHNKEYIIENPRQALVMTNFTLHKHMDGDKPPTAELAKATCQRYAYISDKLATAAGVSEEFLRTTHKAVDAAAPQRPDAKRPPVRTFWHALYYPEERRAKFSYYLHDDPNGGVVRSDYIEVRLDATNSVQPSAPARVAEAPRPVAVATDEKDIVEQLKAAGAVVKVERDHVTEISLQTVGLAESYLPMLEKLPKLRVLALAGTHLTEGAWDHIKNLRSLDSLGLRGTRLNDAGLAQLVTLKNLEVLNVADTAITDAGLAYVGQLTNIAGLNLSGTKVTDAGLAQLKTLGRLTKLNVSKTAVTEQGVAEAKKFLPFWAQVTREVK